MNKVAGSIFLGLIAMGAGPAPASWRTPMLAQATVSPSATYPSTPGDTTPSQIASADANGYTPAPVPDSDQAAPLVQAPEPGQPQWSPSLFRTARTYRGEGFVPGSSVQASQQRNVHPAPGVSLNVPLE